MDKFDDLNDFDDSSFNFLDDDNSLGGFDNDFGSGYDNNYSSSKGEYNSYEEGGGGGIGKLIGFMLLLWILSNLGG